MWPNEVNAARGVSSPCKLRITKHLAGLSLFAMTGDQYGYCFAQRIGLPRAVQDHPTASARPRQMLVGCASMKTLPGLRRYEINQDRYAVTPISTMRACPDPSPLREAPNCTKWPSFDGSEPLRSCEARTPVLQNLGQTQRFGRSNVRKSGPFVRQLLKKSVSTPSAVTQVAMPGGF